MTVQKPKTSSGMSTVDGSICQRSPKRARATNQDDEVSAWNNAGISQMKNGFDAEAETCFSFALYAVECSLVSNSSKVIGTQFADYIAVSSHTVSSFALHHKQIVESDCLLVTGSRTKVMKSEEASKSTYIFQRNEYDEGIDMFTKPFDIPSNSCDPIKASTLYFNLGQCRANREQYELAKRAFEVAANCLNEKKRLGTKSSDVEEFCAKLLVQIHHNIGNCYYRLGKNDVALKYYQESVRLAENVGTSSQLFYQAASQNALGVALFHSIECPNRSGCMGLFQSALETFRSVFGSQSTQVATLCNNIGRVHYVKADYQEALASYKVALDIRRDCLEANSIDLAATICNAGQAYHQLKEYEQALKQYNEFISLSKSLFGPVIDHRDVAITCRCIGEVHHEQGNTSEAVKYYGEALAIGRRAVGYSHPEVSVTLNKLGNLYFESEQYDAALKYYNECVAIEKDVLDSNHPSRVFTLSNIAQIYRRQQNFSMALLTYGEIHGIQLRTYGPKSYEVANTLSNMAFMQFYLLEYKSSYDLYSRTLSIQREGGVDNDNAKSEIAATLSSLGLVSFSMGSFSQALQCFTESLRLRHESSVTEMKDMAILWYNIATVYLEQGDDDKAIQYYSEALSVERHFIDINPQEVIMTLQHIGIVHQRRGDYDDTLLCLREALELQMRCCEKRSVAAARLHNLIGNIHLQKGSISEMMESYSDALRIYRESPDQTDATLVVAGHSIYGFSKIYPPSAPVA
jgi:tetratricopeptide (TPR) repeat protein